MFLLAKGKTAKSMEHLFSINLIANEQSKIVPKLTENGFEKTKIPKDVYAAILTNRKKLLNSGDKWKVHKTIKQSNLHILRQMIIISWNTVPLVFKTA